MLTLALGLPNLLGGCVSTSQDLLPPPGYVTLCESMPTACRNHVYLFHCNGMDFLDCGDLEGLACRLNDLGYIKTYVGYVHHSDYFYSEIQRIHHCDPQARFVMIGSGHGCPQAAELARRAASASIPVDLLVCMNGDMEKVAKYKHQAIPKVVHVRGETCCSESDPKNSGNFVIIPHTGHWGIGTRPETIETVVNEITVVASHVSLVQYVPLETGVSPEAPGVIPMQPPASLPGLPEISPVEPIEQMGQKKVVAGKQTRDEWDFLQVKTPIPQPQPSNADHATNSNLHPVDPKLTSGKPDTDPPGKGPLKRPELVPGKRYMLDDLR